VPFFSSLTIVRNVIQATEDFIINIYTFYNYFSAEKYNFPIVKNLINYFAIEQKINLLYNKLIYYNLK